MPATPGDYTWTIYNGDTWDDVATITTAAGALLDLTGYTARMDIRQQTDVSPTSPGTPIAQLTTANTKLVLGGAAGTVTWNVSATETATWAPGSYAYDLELVSGTGVVHKQMRGLVVVLAEVTR